MFFSSSLCHPPLPFKIDHFGSKFPFFASAESYKEGILRKRANSIGWSFIGGSRVIVKPEAERFILSRKNIGASASWLAGSQLPNRAFTWGTIAVLPYYTLMVLAPRSELLQHLIHLPKCKVQTKRSMESSIPYILLGIVYAYLLYLSCTPETIHLIFATKYLLPKLSSIGKLFCSEMTLASAWIHLLVIDLFAARQVFNDGLENEIETRHSVSLCLLCCPIGLLAHFITKQMTKSNRKI